MITDDEFHILPIAESAITITYGKDNSIVNNQQLIRLKEFIYQDKLPAFLDTSITFNSLTVFFDPRQLIAEGQLNPLAFMLDKLQVLVDRFKINQPPASSKKTFLNGSHHLIPVCYDGDCAPDLLAVAAFHKTDPASIINAHTSQDWYVFMIGFQPGFSYMGILPDNLAMPRKPTPVLKVAPGSVGIAGRQTGIYPNASPGGWQLIGRTPLKQFSLEDESPCLLKAGDTVRFTQIDLATFNYLNQHANS